VNPGDREGMIRPYVRGWMASFVDSVLDSSFCQNIIEGFAQDIKACEGRKTISFFVFIKDLYQIFGPAGISDMPWFYF